jgi:hypothetical protein
VLLVAKTRDAAAKLGRTFQTRSAAKTYWALVKGVPKPPQGKIEAALVKAARYMLEGAVGRMIRNQATAARRAANKPESFLTWLDGFFDDDHRKNFEEAVQPVAGALANSALDTGLPSTVVRANAGAGPRAAVGSGQSAHSVARGQSYVPCGPTRRVQSQPNSSDPATSTSPEASR